MPWSIDIVWGSPWEGKWETVGHWSKIQLAWVLEGGAIKSWITWEQEDPQYPSDKWYDHMNEESLKHIKEQQDISNELYRMSIKLPDILVR